MDRKIKALIEWLDEKDSSFFKMIYLLGML